MRASPPPPSSARCVETRSRRCRPRTRAPQARPSSDPGPMALGHAPVHHTTDQLPRTSFEPLRTGDLVPRVRLAYGSVTSSVHQGGCRDGIWDSDSTRVAHDVSFTLPMHLGGCPPGRAAPAARRARQSGHCGGLQGAACLTGGVAERSSAPRARVPPGRESVGRGARVAVRCAVQGSRASTGLRRSLISTRAARLQL